MNSMLFELRRAAMHEAAHALIAARLGVTGRIKLSVSAAGVDGSFHIAAGQTLSLATCERVAVAGGVAEALHDEPGIGVQELARRLRLLSGGVSRSDAELCGGIVSADAIDDVLNTLRAEWREVEELARRELARFGVGL